MGKNKSSTDQLEQEFEVFLHQLGERWLKQHPQLEAVPYHDRDYLQQYCFRGMEYAYFMKHADDLFKSILFDWVNENGGEIEKPITHKSFRGVDAHQLYERAQNVLYNDDMKELINERDASRAIMQTWHEFSVLDDRRQRTASGIYEGFQHTHPELDGQFDEHVQEFVAHLDEAPDSIVHHFTLGEAQEVINDVKANERMR